MENLSLSSIAVKNILTKISTAEILPNQIITESELCSEFNMSRTPIREALIKLTASGLLERVQRRGYRVVKMSNKEKLDIYTVLGTLDALAAKLAINNMRVVDFEAMDEVIDLIDVSIKHRNYNSYIELQERFHNIYIERCDNNPLIMMLNDIKTTVSRYTYYSDDEDKLFKLNEELNNQHRRIVEFFRDGDSEGLEKYLVNLHWETIDFDFI